jgi:hypothetical protein
MAGCCASVRAIKTSWRSPPLSSVQGLSRIINQFERYHAAGVTHVLARLSMRDSTRVARGTVELLGAR